MRLYCAGPMTGIPDLNRPAFKAAANVLALMGHEAFTPFDVSPANPARTYREHLSRDLQWLCEKAEGIVMLPGWEQSPGARAEHATALAIGLPVWHEQNGEFFTSETTMQRG